MLDRQEWFAAAACAALTGALAGAATLVPKIAAHAPHAFVRTEVMVPMRDGVKLQTVYYVPRGKKGPLPILLARTPYGVPKPDAVLDDWYPDLDADGYVYAMQNIRGRFGSEGEFVMQRPPRTDPAGVDETTDAYDTVDWLVKNVPENSGKVGIWGTSYPGFLTAAALADPHPALACASERAAMDELFANDDFHHNGALRLSYAFEYSYMLETKKDDLPAFPFDTLDLYDWYLRLGALSHVDERHFHGKVPTWENLVAHPSDDAFWRSRAPSVYLTHTTVPNLNVAGWYDEEDFVGPMSVYASLEKSDDAHVDFLVVGPWDHGGWSWGESRKLGAIDFGADTGKDFRANEQRRFFAHYLHGAPDPGLPEATIFETGTNTWKKLDAWPPKTGVVPTRLYLRDGRRASFEAPMEYVASDSYVSDPQNPVPYRQRPIGPTYPGPEWPKWLTEDQRFVDHRPDVLTWETDPLDHDVVIAGDVVAELYASTSGSDADWIVKLIDVLPEQAPKPDEDAGADAGPASLHGYELMVASEILRGRFRDGLATPVPIVPNRVVKYAIDLHTRAHAFLAGHRIMVQVQSTWFPLYDRNPQSFVENIFLAKDDDYQKAVQEILRSKDQPSAVVLPIVSR